MRGCLADELLKIARGDILPLVFKEVEPAPKQDHSPAVILEPGPEGAELISSSIQYLSGISEDLTGWSLFKRIEQGREHRFATDSAGAVRWERTYTQIDIL
jgi:hypothetical protein